jgi:hypothetical protein
MFFYILFITKYSSNNYIFKKQKKMTFYESKIYEFAEIKNNLFTFRYAINFYMNIVNAIFVY